MTERNGPGAAGGLSEASSGSEKANGEKQETAPEVHSEEVEEHPRGGPATSPGGLAEAPDGGWGWVVLLATIVVLALTLAFPSCVGIFYTDLQNDFHASNSETSWVPSIMTSVLHAGGRVHICFLSAPLLSAHQSVVGEVGAGGWSRVSYNVLRINYFLFWSHSDTAQGFLLLLFYEGTLKPHRSPDWLF